MSASPTTWSVPWAWVAIAAVIVRPGSRGLVSKAWLPAAPPAMKTTIVSPMARETARMAAATSPETDAGSTTLTTVVSLRAPKPSLASRNALGTARRASSDTDATSGMERMPTAIPAVVRLKSPASKKRCTIEGEITEMAKNPRTTLGIPASTSRVGFSTLRTPGRAYSDR